MGASAMAPIKRQGLVLVPTSTPSDVQDWTKQDMMRKVLSQRVGIVSNSNNESGPTIGSSVWHS